ncbi:MAG: hypothetical protein GY813_20040, partial [Halieaceae bacterium]|nr:hypothetical protein [Halieaceae bacterium]
DIAQQGQCLGSCANNGEVEFFHRSSIVIDCSENCSSLNENESHSYHTEAHLQSSPPRGGTPVTKRNPVTEEMFDHDATPEI